MLTVINDADLYVRGMQTLLASWEVYADGAPGATVLRLPGLAAAVFPNEPERAVYNNAVLERDLGPLERADAVDAMEAAYEAAGVGHFAAWVHESDVPMRINLERRGYSIEESTLAMGMPLDHICLPRPVVELAPPDWSDYLRVFLPPGLLSGADPAAFHVLIACLDGERVAAGLALDFDGDCGIYNVETLEHARRRGLGTALTALLVYDALVRGCETASLQSTKTAEHLYAAVGFQNLGQILEYAPHP